jgi:predicted amidohydrolase YtcJ
MALAVVQRAPHDFFRGATMQWYWRIAALISVIFVASCGDSSNVESDEPAREQQPADWVLTGGRILTVDDQTPWAEAVAMRDGEFVFVGDGAGVEAFVGDATRKVDLSGRLVLPGLIDAHTHPAYVELEQFGAALPETSPEELLEAVQAYAESHPDDDWIRLCCWPSQFYVRGVDGPHKRDLDAIVADRPVWITSLPWHSYWLNSKALGKAHGLGQGRSRLAAFHARLRGRSRCSSGGCARVSG